MTMCCLYQTVEFEVFVSVACKASPVSLHPSTAPTTPTTPEALKQSSKRGKKMRVRLNLFSHKRRKALPLESPTNSEGRLFDQSLSTICQSQPDGTLPPPIM